MPRAVLKNGVVQPIEPLPKELGDGQELVIEAATKRIPDEDELRRIDEWMKDVEEAAALIDPETERQFIEAIAAIRREAKEQALRDMGLTG